MEFSPLALISIGLVFAVLTAVIICLRPVKFFKPTASAASSSSASNKKKKLKPAKKSSNGIASPATSGGQPRSRKPIVRPPVVVETTTIYNDDDDDDDDDDVDDMYTMPVRTPKEPKVNKKSSNVASAVESSDSTLANNGAAEMAAKEAEAAAAKMLKQKQEKEEEEAKKAAAERQKACAAAESARAAAAEAAAVAAAAAAEEEKKKKPKETPEQKLARLERQRLAKEKKKAEETLAKDEAIAIAAAHESDTTDDIIANSKTAEPVEDWAVVEDKRKTKIKKSESQELAVPETTEKSSSSTSVETPSIPTHIPTPAVVVTAPIIVPAVVPVPPPPVEVVSTPVAVEEPVVPVIPPEPIDFVESQITVDGKKLGAVIGVKGVNLKAIQETTGATLSTPKGERDNTVPATVTVSGTKDAVAKATRAIKDLATKGYSKLIAGEDFQESSVMVHPMYLAEIIGKGGCNIRAIQEATSVKLNIPQVARDHALPVKVTMAGNKEKVAQAKAIVTEMTTYYRSDVTHPNTVHLEMDVPAVYYNYIIGARGSEIKHIQGNFKVSVHIPNADTINKNIVIVGESAGVKNAEKYIQKVIDKVTKDKEDAERAADAAVDAGGKEDTPAEEEWMNQYTHPSRKAKTTDASTEEETTPAVSTLASSDTADATNAATTTSSTAGEVSILKTGEKSSAAAAAAASAWGASVLASADGW